MLAYKAKAEKYAKIISKTIILSGMDAASFGQNAYFYDVADEHGGKLKSRCVFFCDGFGTLPKIESAEMLLSASRSRRLQIVPIVQSFSQREKNYGREGAEIIVDNTQLTINEKHGRVLIPLPPICRSPVPPSSGQSRI